MAKIINIKGRQVFDSRGNPTVEAEVYLMMDKAISNISIWCINRNFEAFELRDGENKNI